MFSDELSSTAALSTEDPQYYGMEATKTRLRSYAECVGRAKKQLRNSASIEVHNNINGGLDGLGPISNVTLNERENLAHAAWLENSRLYQDQRNEARLLHDKLQSLSSMTDVDPLQLQMLSEVVEGANSRASILKGGVQQSVLHCQRLAEFVKSDGQNKGKSRSLGLQALHNSLQNLFEGQ